MYSLLRLGLGLVVATSAISAAPQQRDAQPAGSVAARTEATAHLTGRIVAAADGLALPRALVAITVGGRIHSTASTDPEGRFDIDAPNAAPYSVTVSKSGYVSATLPRPARRGRSTLELSLALAAVISGRVVDPGGNPVTSIRVTVQRADADQVSFETSVVTDDLGSFRVPGLSPGRYTVVTRGRPEYASIVSDQSSYINVTNRPPLTRNTDVPPTSAEPVDVDVETGTTRDVTINYRDSAIVLPYAPVGGVVSGQITDDAGEPAVGLSVQLWRIEFAGAALTATRNIAPRTTDDRGQYRMFHVKAGRYVLVVTDDSAQTANRDSSWLPVYYPGTEVPAGAMILKVGRSQELGGIDMSFTHATGARIFGQALNASGAPLENVLRLVSANQDLPLMPQTITVDADGAFEFERVPPGEYVIRTMGNSVRGGAPTANADFGMQRIRVTDADIGPLVFKATQPATLRGHIVFEGMAPLRTNFSIEAVTTDPLYTSGIIAGLNTISSGRIDAGTWTFELPRLAGPIRLSLSAIPPGVWLKSAYVGGVNAAEAPVMLLSAKDSRDDVTLVIAGTAGTISGRTVTSAAAPSPGVQVVAYSTSRERWFSGSPYVQGIYSDETSRFTLQSLPPGEYWVIALDSSENELNRSDADRAEFLESLIARAQRITLGEGAALSLNPRTIAIAH